MIIPIYAKAPRLPRKIFGRVMIGNSCRSIAPTFWAGVAPDLGPRCLEEETQGHVTDMRDRDLVNMLTPVSDRRECHSGIEYLALLQIPIITFGLLTGYAADD